MKVKICGIRSYADARAALDEGAWAIGFVFHRPSRRFIEPEAAGRIVRRLPADALAVGVFVDRPLEEVRAIVRGAGLRGAQLHGAEDAGYAAGVGAELVIKALRVGEAFRPRDVLEFPGCRVLLDAASPDAPGGTGQRCDWALARGAAALAPVILAGGIHPENVRDAVRAVRPDAIDLSSGVESAPGVKDRRRMRSLFEALAACGREEEAPGDA